MQSLKYSRALFCELSFFPFESSAFLYTDFMALYVIIIIIIKWSGQLFRNCVINDIVLWVLVVVRIKFPIIA